MSTQESLTGDYPMIETVSVTGFSDHPVQVDNEAARVDNSKKRKVTAKRSEMQGVATTFTGWNIAVELDSSDTINSVRTKTQDKMQVIFETHNGRTITFEVERSDSTNNVKINIQKKLGMIPFI